MAPPEPALAPPRKRRGWGWAGLAAVLLLGIGIFVRWQQGAIVNPPYCAWRFISNFASWNVAFPDSTSVYHVSLMHINQGDEIKIWSPSLPYARYFSFQSYSIPDFTSSASMRDVDILPLPPSHPHHGPNCYTNLSAAMAGTKQGGYEVVITAHGNTGYPNELRALADDRDSGFFIVFFRIYQDRADSPPSLPPSASSAFQADLNKCFGPQGLYPEETPQEWGWACPPTVAVRRVFQHGSAAKFEPLPMCGYRRKHGITYNDITPPVIHCAPNREPNRPYNFFLPSPFYLKQKFANKDAKYLFSCAEAPGVPEGTNGVGGWVHRKDEKKEQEKEEGREEGKEEGEEEEPELWARVTGKLPRTANGLYSPPFIANFSDYDVRYVSLSSVGRSLPYRGYKTLHDADIIEHYLREVGPEWLEGDRSFTLWFGPPHVVQEEEDSSLSSSLLPAVVAREKALFLPWGKSFRGEHIPFPGVLYRQILSRGQVLRTKKEGGRTGERNSSSSETNGEEEQSCPLHSAATTAAPTVSEWGRAAAAAAAGSPTAGLAEIIPPTCEKRDERAKEGEGKEVVSKHMCCGPSAPEWCHDPSFVASKMKGFYPLVEYFYRWRSRRGEEGESEEEEEDMERIGGEEDDSRKLSLVEGEELSQPSCFEEEEEVVLGGGGGGEGGEVSLSTEEMASSFLNLVSDIWTIVYSYIHF